MVKVKILIPFEDKETHKKYKKNEIVEMLPKRFNEIKRKLEAYVELAEDDTAKTKTEK